MIPNDKESFDRLMSFIYDAEGYKSNDPKDPGGETIFGISATYHPDDVAKMRDMSHDEAWVYAKGIYYKEYWVGSRCNGRPWPNNICVGDMAINQGVGRAMTLWFASKDWTHFLLKRLRMYGDIKGGDPVLHGHMDRVLNLFDYIESFE